MATPTLDFTLSAHQQLAAISSPDANLVSSPANMAAAMAGVSEGAVGETYEELRRALGVSNPGDMARDYQALLAGGRDTVRAGTRVWAVGAVNTTGNAAGILRSVHRAEIVAADFAGNAAAVEREINGWVDALTAHQIAKLLNEGTLDATTAMVLGAAVAFDGKWQQAFDVKDTADRPFTLDPQRFTSISVPTMYGAKRDVRLYGGTSGMQFGYGRTTGRRRVEVEAMLMPYKDTDLQYVAILPPQGMGMPEFERTMLTPSNIEQWLREAQEQKVNVMLPRYVARTRIEDARGIFGRLGVSAAFDRRRADFSLFNDDPGLFISQIIHEAMMDVNEEGTKGSAATAVVMRLRGGGGDQTPTFAANRPFVYMVADSAGRPLFSGRMMNPGQK